MNHPLTKLCVCLTLGITAFSSAQAQTSVENRPRNPAVEAVLELPRETPADELSAVLLLIDLGEPGHAVRLLEPLIAKALDDETRASMVGQFGTARLLRLARQDEAEFPGARKFVAACMKSAATQARDPKRLARLVAGLNDPKVEVRGAAQTDLKTTGTHGAAACLEALAKATDETQRARLMRAIASLRPEADPLLLAALADGKGHFQRDLAELSGHTEMLAAVPWLAQLSVCSPDSATADAARTALAQMGISSPSPTEVRILLMREIKRLEANHSLRPVGSDVESVWWTWQTAGKFESQNFPAEQYQTLISARLARMLLTCGDPTPAEKRFALLHYLESRHVLEKAASQEDLRQRFTTDELSTTLAEATQLRRAAAALAIIRELATRADHTALISPNGKPTPLAAALKNPLPNLRFAALEAILTIAPSRGFAGSSQVAKNLWFFAGQKGEEHTARANQSLAWLAKFLEQGSPYDELLRDVAIASQTLHTPGRTEASMQVLQWAGTAGSQRSLLDFASQTRQPLELRQQAADALAASFERHGKQLTSHQIRQQYDRYNESESADRETQQLLGKLLDLFETGR